ncbi:hypothetical protein KEM56_004190 [Ascosphaera pollenicola]|nr:hypothetical protein KEM56_004190 [Ascosphaera pollenicola]
MSSGFLVLIPQSNSEPTYEEHVTTYAPSISSAASSVSDTDENSFLVLAPHHRRTSVSSVSSVSSVDSNASSKEVRFLGLVPETQAKRHNEPEIVPDTDCVNIMKPFRNGFLRLG